MAAHVTVPAHVTVHLHPAGPGGPPAPASPDAAPAVSVGRWTATLDAHDPGGRLVRVEEHAGVWGALLGTVYDTSLTALLRAYRAHGDAFADDVDGSFALLLLDGPGGRALAVTDRVGGRTVYHVHADDSVHVSTRPDLPEFTSRPVCHAGVAALLVNGYLPAGLTPYDGVRALAPATVHDLRPGGPRAAPYWQIPFDPAPPGRPDAAHAADLVDALRAAVRRRARACGPRPMLSLSGGYDSRGLLALLHAEPPAAPLHTFAYALPPVRRDSDPAVAARLAARYGMAHDQFVAYGGDLVRAVARNARHGQGVAPYCEEVDALHDLAAHDPTDVFTGEQVFELQAAPLATAAQRLVRSHVNAATHLDWLSPHVPSATHVELTAAWTAEYDAIAAQAGGWHHGYRAELGMQLGHYEPCGLLRWRERFLARDANLHVPYLDAQVLDVLGHLPVHLMAGKAALKLALRQLDPGLFRVPLATTQGYEPDWRRELRALDEGQLNALLAFPSRLDVLIDPATIRRLLRDLPAGQPGARQRVGAAVRQRLGTWRRTPLGRRVMGHPPLRPRVPDRPAVILKLLTLREVLRDDR